MKVLICGCERSGTTIVASLLSKSSGLTLLNDPKESWYIYPLVKTMGLRGMPISFIVKLWKHSIVKVPGFATILPQLKRVNLNAFKVVYLVRDPRDTYAAIKERLNADYNGLFLNISFLNLKGQSECENIALRWNSYLEHAKAYDVKLGNVLFVRYEDFLKDKLKTLEAIANYCNLKIDTSIITEDLDVQINKRWSEEIKGHGRYLDDLSNSEVEIITKHTKTNMELFKYK